ncbi:MAG: exsH [Rhodocyclales bacterium]|nr:exsH [Rhodocyclales bacterium]
MKNSPRHEFRLQRRHFLRDSGLVAGSLWLPRSVFANTSDRTLNFCGKLPEGMHFQRESRATLASIADKGAGLSVVAASQPRFVGTPADCQGVLLEGAAQNRVRNANALSPQSFALSNGGDATPAPNEKGPDGSAGVIKLSRRPTGGNSIVDMWVPTAADGDFCTASVWLRSPAGSGTWRLRLIDFTTYNGNAALVEVGPEWQRYAVTLTLHLRDTGARRFAVALSEPVLKPGMTADPRTALTQVLMWGPQVESGNDASSYVPPGEPAMTRSADALSMPSSWLPASGGVTLNLPAGGRHGAVILDAGDKSGGNDGGLRLQYTNSGWLRARVGSVTATGFGDRTADTWVRLEWSGAGVQIFSGKTESTMTPLANTAGKARLDVGQRMRLGMTDQGGQPLNRPLALAKITAATAPLASIKAPAFVSNAYRISFEDDFNDSNLTRINENATGGKPGAPAWRSRYRHERNKFINAEKQIYVDPAYTGSGTQPVGIQPFAIADSVLTIRAERTPAPLLGALSGQRYTSGCITTELTHWQTYGYFEMRARLPRGKGFWPAFWLLPKRATWPPEIDVLEASGARPHDVHVGFLDKSQKYAQETGKWVNNGIDTSDAFHLYALEWTADQIAYFIDGKQVFQVGPHGIHEDMYLLANLALGSHDAGWVPDPDDSTPFPGKFEIDYIRAYSKS